MANKSKRNAKSRRSQKGKWGHIGAPPKTTRWPSRPFTMATLFSRNSHQCELSLRNKVEAGVKAGEILALQPKKQAGGAVGRPKSVFVLKANYDKNTMTLADGKAKTPKARKTKVTVAAAPAPVAVAPAAPAPVAPAPVATSATPAPAPAVESPAPAPVAAPASTAPVSTAPAAPATPEPAIG
jgi:hypothetical protein